MNDPIIEIFDQQRAAFDRLNKRVEVLSAKLDALPAETLKQTSKANTEVLAALNRRSLSEIQAAERAEARTEMLDRIYAQLYWIAPLLILVALIAGLVFLFPALTKVDALCRWTGGTVVTGNSGAVGCIYWR